MALDGKRVAILVTEGFEQAEMVGPRKALEDAGAKTEIVSPAGDEVQGWNHYDKGDWFKVDVGIDAANANDYDALLLPGGVANPDLLRNDDDAVSFVRSFVEQAKPIGAICHGPWTLVEADVIKGRTLTSFPSIKTDIRNAGGNWVDEEVVVDKGLVTSRKPDDLPAFCAKIVEEFCEGTHEQLAEATSGSSARAS